MDATPNNRTTRTLIVAESGSVRQMLSDAARALGFLDLTVLGSGEDALNLLEVEECDWLIMPMMAAGSVNALQILRVLVATPRLRKVRVSLIHDVQEDVLLPAAFELGLMSAHPKSYLREDMIAELKGLQDVLKAFGGKAPLVAAEYLRRHLLKTKQFPALLGLEQGLLSVLPGSAGLLLKLGEAQILNGRTQEGMMTLHQATVIDETCKDSADNLCKRLINAKVVAPPAGDSASNVLGIETCVLVDPDSAVLNGIAEFLRSVGVPRIECFDDGTAAWDWLSKNKEPDLILQEWRIPGLSGPMLLQRVRQLGFAKVGINVISSVIKPKEVHLLREMGADDVVAKPFSRQTFFKSVIWTIQQNVSPTERGSLERRISRLLKAGQVEEAERLHDVLTADPRIPTAAKKVVQAEFAFHYGKYRAACDLGVESLRLAGDSLRLLDLIGKSLIKLGDHGAALKFFEKAHALSPLNVEHLCNLAVCRFDNGDAKAAESAVAEAKVLDSKNDLVGRTECQIAIMSGQTGKAKDLMGQLSSVQKIVGYMNNRAVALSRCGRYEDGIKLYQQTAESLPGESGDMHDIVAYNWGLAYARYGELEPAGNQLARILKRPESQLFKKATSLQKRVKHAADTGGALLLNAGASEEEIRAATTGTPEELRDGIKSRESLAAALQVKRGEACLNGIFQAEAMDPEAKRLLEKVPRFSERNAIDRPEAMTKIS